MAFHDPKKYVNEKTLDAIAHAFDRPGAVAAQLAAYRGQKFEAFEDLYKTIEHRALLIWGEEDQVSFVEYGERLMLDMPHSRLVAIPQCGHMPMIEAPHQLIRLIKDFLGASEHDLTK